MNLAAQCVSISVFCPSATTVGLVESGRQAATTPRWIVSLRIVAEHYDYAVLIEAAGGYGQQVLSHDLFLLTLFLCTRYDVVGSSRRDLPALCNYLDRPARSENTGVHTEGCPNYLCVLLSLFL